MIDTSKDWNELNAVQQDLIKQFLGYGWSIGLIKRAMGHTWQGLQVHNSQIRRIRDELQSETIFV